MNSFINLFEDESDLFNFEKPNAFHSEQLPSLQVSVEELFDDDETQVPSSSNYLDCIIFIFTIRAFITL